MTKPPSDDGDDPLAELRALVAPDILAGYERDLKIFELLERRAPPGARAWRHAETERLRLMVNTFRKCAKVLEWDIVEGGKP